MRVSLCLVIATFTVSTVAVAMPDPGFMSTLEIREAYWSCLQRAQSPADEELCVKTRRVRLTQRQRTVAYAKNLYRARYRTAKLAYRDCRRISDRAGARRHKVWLKGAKRWWRDYRRFAKRGGVLPSLVLPPELPQACGSEAPSPPVPAAPPSPLAEVAKVAPNAKAPVAKAPPAESPAKAKAVLPEFDDKVLLDVGDPVDRVAVAAREAGSQAFRSPEAQTRFLATVSEISLAIHEAMTERREGRRTTLLTATEARLGRTLPTSLDGCAKTGQADADDVVIDCGAQRELQLRLQEAARWTEQLKGEPPAEF